MKTVILNSIILILILILIIFSNNIFNNNNNFAVILDTGKADCIIIKYDDIVLVIDTAESEDFYKIQDFLSSNNINKIDYLIITHFDKDHVGGASQLIDNYQVLNIIEPNYFKDSEHVDNYRSSIKNSENTNIIVLNNNLELDLENNNNNNNNKINLIPTNLKDANSNNNSIIGELFIDNKKILLMGDAEEERIQEYLNNNTNINNNINNYDFVKMPHHGNYNNMLENLINYANPKAVGITCSNKNPADDETLDLLKKYNIQTYLTSTGNIDILDILNK